MAFHYAAAELSVRRFFRPNNAFNSICLLRPTSVPSQILHRRHCPVLQFQRFRLYLPSTLYNIKAKYVAISANGSQQRKNLPTLFVHNIYRRKQNNALNVPYNYTVVLEMVEAAVQQYCSVSKQTLLDKLTRFTAQATRNRMIDIMSITTVIQSDTKVDFGRNRFLGLSAVQPTSLCCSGSDGQNLMYSIEFAILKHYNILAQLLIT